MPDEWCGARGATRLLLVENDLAIRRTVSSYLEEHGIQTVTVANRREMVRQFAAAAPSLIILSPLSDRIGLNTLCELRSHTDAPVIIIAGDNEIDRIVGLEFGANDYLPKPPAPSEATTKPAF